jgi:hypothetical protein
VKRARSLIANGKFVTALVIASVCLTLPLYGNVWGLDIPDEPYQTAGVMMMGGGVAAAAGPTNYTLDANIISWWMMEENTTTARDDPSTNNNNLPPVGDTSSQPRSTTKIQGTYSCEFISTNYDRLAIADAAPIHPTTFPGKASTGGQGAFSIGAWVYPHAVGTTRRFIIGKYDAGNEESYAITISTASHFDFAVAGASDYWGDPPTAIITGGTTVLVNTWYHVVGVYTGTYLQLWVGTVSGASAQDATQVAATPAVYRSTADFIIGASHGGQNGFDGYIDEAFIFNRALNTPTSGETESIRAHGLAGER